MTSEQAEGIAESINKTLKRLTVAVIACLILSVGVGIYAWWNSDRVNDALCTFRDDVEIRSINAQDFLDDHPEGFAGIPAAQLQQSIDGQRRTVRALSSLDCPPLKLR